MTGPVSRFPASEATSATLASDYQSTTIFSTVNETEKVLALTARISQLESDLTNVEALKVRILKLEAERATELPRIENSAAGSQRYSANTSENARPQRQVLASRSFSGSANTSERASSSLSDSINCSENTRQGSLLSAAGIDFGDILSHYQFMRIKRDGNCFFSCILYALRNEFPNLTIEAMRDYCSNTVD